MILGVSYKENIDDVRESPAIKIIELLKKRNFIVNYHDPHVPYLKAFNMKNTKLTSKKIRKYDCSILVTYHKKINWKLIKNNSKMILDTRGKIYKDQKIFIYVNLEKCIY